MSIRRLRGEAITPRRPATSPSPPGVPEGQDGQRSRWCRRCCAGAGAQGLHAAPAPSAPQHLLLRAVATRRRLPRRLFLSARLHPPVQGQEPPNDPGRFELGGQTHVRRGTADEAQVPPQPDQERPRTAWAWVEPGDAHRGDGHQLPRLRCCGGRLRTRTGDSHRSGLTGPTTGRGSSEAGDASSVSSTT